MGDKAKSNPLLNAFEGKHESFELLYKHWENKKYNAIGAYGDIVKAIRKYLNSPGKSPAQHQTNGTGGVDDSTQPRYDPVVIMLKDILNYEEKKGGVKFKKAKLFEKAIENAAEDYPLSKSHEEWKSEPTYIITQALCLLNPDMAFNVATDGSSGFGYAAEKGATTLASVMINELLYHLKAAKKLENQNLEEAVRSYLSRKHKKNTKTPFLMAAENLQRGVLELLLENYSYLAEMDSVKAIIKKTAEDHGETDQDEALEVFKLVVQKMDPKTVNDAEIWTEAVKTSSLTVVQYLIKERGSEFVTYPNAKIIMESGTVKMWEEFDLESRKGFMKREKCDLLHTAVKKRNATLVENILENFPKQIEVNLGSIDDPKYAMQGLKQPGKEERTDKGSPYMTIRNALLDAMICSTSRELGIKEIRDILRKSLVDADTICLHLSTINTEDQSFAEYVQWLKAQKGDTGKLFKFEKILKYAKFPDLNTQIPKHTQDVAADMRVDYNEIRIVFEWLKDREVEQVLELSVPDRLFSPHSDTDVQYCVDNFGVRVLNWRKLDLYLGNLLNKDHLQELHLYSSGNQSVHEQWYKELSVHNNFKNLRKLYVKVVVNVLSKTRVGEVKAELQKRLDDINKDLGYRWTKRPEKGKMPPKFRVGEFDWATDGRGRTYRGLDEITNDVVGSNLAAFVRKFKDTFNKETTRKTKVAVIDSGVVLVSAKGKAQDQAQDKAKAQDKGLFSKDKEQGLEGKEQLPEDVTHWWANDLAKHVVDGTSFVNTGDNEEQVWWHASEPHGTQMARLICSIDPLCELYVVKVAETRSSGVAANVVAQAIDWAIKKEVDVISLSLVTYADNEGLSKAIMRARSKDIVILSSTADEGLTKAEGTIREKNLRDIFPITACDRWGNLLAPSQKDKDDYRFVGNNVQVGQVPFLKSEETITGSSVATAIAAGTASLILAFCRISTNYNTDRTDVRGQENIWRCSIVGTRFDEMCEVQDKKYVVLENLCGKERKKRLGNDDFVATVNASFTDKQKQ